MMNKTNHLQTKYRTLFWGSILCYVLVFTFWMLHVPLRMPYITMPGFLLCGLLGGFLSKEAKKYRSGVQGEKDTSRLLTQLPEDCVVFSDVKIHLQNNEKAEMDSVIVSPNGVFIVETKNHRGDIVGDIVDKHWTQQKIGKGGTPYSKSMYSPVKQVKTHTWKLSQYLKERGIKTWIDSAVYFSNPDATVSINGMEESDVPIFCYQESYELVDFIKTSGKKKLSQEDMDSIIRVLKQAS